jgi:hypothetical protein
MRLSLPTLALALAALSAPGASARKPAERGVPIGEHSRRDPDDPTYGQEVRVLHLDEAAQELARRQTGGGSGACGLLSGSSSTGESREEEYGEGDGGAGLIFSVPAYRCPRVPAHDPVQRAGPAECHVDVDGF